MGRNRRGRGEGSIYKRKDGRWQGYITTGYDPKTGNPKRKILYGKTRRETQEKITELKAKMDKGIYREPTKMTVKEWLRRWLKGKKPYIAYSTWRNYRGMIENHIIPEIGRIKLRELQANQIQEMINKKLKKARVDGKKGNLSPRSIKYIVQTLSTALEQAVKERIIYYNEAKLVETPKQVKREIQVLTKKELPIFLSKTRESRHYPAYFLTLSTGLRLGELLGMTWGNIDFEKGTITVKQQIVHEEGGRVIKPILKTERSGRTIKVPDNVVAELKKHKKIILEEKIAMGAAYNDHDLVFCVKNGEPYDPRNFFRYFKENLKKAGIEKNIRFHDIRHTFATLSLQEGVHPIRVQNTLGHTSIKTTLDLYAHVTEEIEEQGAEAIGSILEECITGG